MTKKTFSFVGEVDFERSANGQSLNWKRLKAKCLSFPLLKKVKWQIEK
jgi:hypothetical protein